MSKIRVALAGVGNCASALVQGVAHYSENDDDLGLSFRKLGGYDVSDIEFAAAFDVSSKKVGKDLSRAIGEKPNNTPKIAEVKNLGVTVKKGPVMDGIGRYLQGVVPLSTEVAVDIEEELKGSGAQVLINYLPVGSTNATFAYAEAALRSRTAFICAIPVFVASDSHWSRRFRRARVPVAGDDVMSQVGATVLHKTMVKMWWTGE